MKILRSHWIQAPALLMRASGFAACLLLVAAQSGCSSSNQDPELKQAARVAHYLSSPRHLRQSMYSEVHETGAPSEWIGYLFSTMGAAERPPFDDGSEMDREQAAAINMPLQPVNVALVPWEPDKASRKQVVIRADDAQRLIIIDAYLAPDQPPVFSDSWPMPEFSASD